MKSFIIYAILGALCILGGVLCYIFLPRHTSPTSDTTTQTGEIQYRTENVGVMLPRGEGDSPSSVEDVGVTMSSSDRGQMVENVGVMLPDGDAPAMNPLMGNSRSSVVTDGEMRTENVGTMLPVHP